MIGFWKHGKKSPQKLLKSLSRRVLWICLSRCVIWIWQPMGRTLCSFIVLNKITLVKLEKKSWKNNCQSLQKKICKPFEIDESDIALAVSEFPLVDLDYDNDEEDKIEILTEYYFSFWFCWNLKIKHIGSLQIFVLLICTEENLISAPAKELPLPNKRHGIWVENLKKHPRQLFNHLR